MDFVSWLEGLPQETASQLYTSHWACQAVLRGLPPIAKQYVLRLLFLDVPVLASAPLSCTTNTIALTAFASLAVLLWALGYQTFEPTQALHYKETQHIQALLTGHTTSTS